jgi:hypothetical protein
MGWIAMSDQDLQRVKVLRAVREEAESDESFVIQRSLRRGGEHVEGGAS